MFFGSEAHPILMHNISSNESLGTFINISKFDILKCAENEKHARRS